MNTKPVYFPGLNGLRAIAALAVVISHITINLKDFNLDPYIFGAFEDGKPRGLNMAGYGVSIFFVLSGFLITYLLQVEKDLTGINIKKFYVRRILRIWPLYYLYLAISIVAILLFGLDLNVRSLMLYIFYAANVPFVLGSTLPFLTHYWSLGVEEQFYLFWPWINKKSNSLLTITISLTLILFGSKLALHFLSPNSLLERILTVTRFHCMMIGAMGAILYKSGNKIFLPFADNKVTQFICWGILFLAAINKFHIISVIDNEIISVVTLLVILGQIRIKNRIVNLETPAFDFLGKISYGIYVYHPILIYLFSKLLGSLAVSHPIKYFIVYALVVSSTILIAYLSFRYFEKYFLNFKKKFEIVKSSSAKSG